MASPLVCENVWLHQQKFEDAELLYRLLQAGTQFTLQKTCHSLVGDIAQVRRDIQTALGGQSLAVAGGDASVYQRLDVLEKENKELRKLVDELRSAVFKTQACNRETVTVTLPPPQKAIPVAPAPADEDDDDCDLFGSDDEETKAIKEKRLQEYAEKKAKKPALIAKSSVMLDVKPWDDETDMAEMEKRVRSIEQDGLVWGASKLVPVGYGIKKLSIICVVEDDKVSIEDLSEKITQDNDDLVQSVDVAAFNKI